MRVLFISDQHGDPAGHAAVVARALAEGEPRPDAIWCGGDCVVSNTADQWQRFGAAFALLRNTVRLPAQIARGNHDTLAGYQANVSRALWRTVRYEDGVAVHVMDSMSPRDPGSAQYKWIVNELAEDKRQGVRHAFVVLHIGLYSSRNETDAIAREHLAPVFAAHNVRAVLTGHFHAYERSEVDGVHYLSVGLGGGRLADPDRWYLFPPQDFTRYRESDSHGYGVIEVGYSSVMWHGVRVDGTRFDPVTLWSASSFENPRQSWLARLWAWLRWRIQW